MARSFQGGTRGFIRGRVANDLYQVTKDAAGKRIQLVRSVEESRENPNTIRQAMARMQMALCMGSVSQFKSIIDHSWETIPYGQLSIAHFVKVNIPVIQQDCISHWAYENLFDYPTKGDVAIRAGAWIMSEGTLTLPSILSNWNSGNYGFYTGFQLNFPKQYPTMAEIKSYLGLAAGDYITHCCFAQGRVTELSKFAYFRVYLNPDCPDDLVFGSANFERFFLYESNFNFYKEVVSGSRAARFSFSRTQVPNCVAFPVCCQIVSRWDGRHWCRNNAQLLPTPGYEDYSADWTAPRWTFQSYYPDYDPDQSDEYPL